MFDISFMEILIISIVALVVVGPERLPKVARTLGHIFGRCRSFVYNIKTDIHNEIRMEELKSMHHSMQETAQSIEQSVRQEVDQLAASADTILPQNDTSGQQNQVQATNNPTQSPAVQQQTSEAGKSAPTSTQNDHH